MLPISEDLVQLADRWPLRESVFTAPNGTEKTCQRCTQEDCGQMIQGGEDLQQGIMIHLLSSHGYRMNGKQYDNHNRMIGEAKDAYRQENPLP